MSFLKRPHSLIWLGIPALCFATIIYLELFWTNSLRYLYQESGPVELIQFGILLFSLFILIQILSLKLKPDYTWLKYFLGFCFICCFYIAAEEVSWGQSFFYWQASVQWNELNNQGETNLHNTSRWLNQIPRYGLMAAIGVGGLILPVLNLFGKKIFPKKYDIIKPPNMLCVTAIMLLILALGNKISKLITDEKLFFRASEIEELFIYLFIMIYLLLLKDSIHNIVQTPKV